jgi:hypothetical protein
MQATPAKPADKHNSTPRYGDSCVAYSAQAFATAAPLQTCNVCPRQHRTLFCVQYHLQPGIRVTNTYAQQGQNHMPKRVTRPLMAGMPICTSLWHAKPTANCTEDPQPPAHLTPRAATPTGECPFMPAVSPTNSHLCSHHNSTLHWYLTPAHTIRK